MKSEQEESLRKQKPLAISLIFGTIVISKPREEKVASFSLRAIHKSIHFQEVVPISTLIPVLFFSKTARTVQQFRF